MPMEYATLSRAPELGSEEYNRCSLVSYLGHPFFVRGSYSSAADTLRVLIPHLQISHIKVFEHLNRSVKMIMGLFLTDRFYQHLYSYLL